MRFPLSLILVVAAASQVGATDCGQITRDQGFDLWCGDALCTWKLERGEIKKVGTWNKNDSGVEMIGPDVAFEQLTPVTSGDTTCIRFELISNVEESAEVRLNVDVYGDGSVEHSERIPTSNWKPLSYRIPIRMPYGGVRFEITKQGPGKAVVAQLQAETAPKAECEGFTEVIPAPAPNGGVCDVDAACQSGLCRIVNDPTSWFGIAKVCVGCDPSLGASACVAGDTCGVGKAASRVLHVPLACVAIGGHALGEQCVTNAECASNICNSFVCSSCSTSAGCAGESCALAYDKGPHVCNPGGHTRTVNQPCTSDDDCVSNRCRGTERKQCGDGRVCSSPEQCPVEDDLAPGPCESSGIQGGRCE